MGVTAERDVRVERVAARDDGLTEEDRAALWLYQRLVGARHRPPPRRPRSETVYDESGYPLKRR